MSPFDTANIKWTLPSSFCSTPFPSQWTFLSNSTVTHFNKLLVDSLFSCNGWGKFWKSRAQAWAGYGDEPWDRTRFWEGWNRHVCAVWVGKRGGEPVWRNGPLETHFPKVCIWGGVQMHSVFCSFFLFCFSLPIVYYICYLGFVLSRAFLWDNGVIVSVAALLTFVKGFIAIVGVAFCSVSFIVLTIFVIIIFVLL